MTNEESLTENSAAQAPRFSAGHKLPATDGGILSMAPPHWKRVQPTKYLGIGPVVGAMAFPRRITVFA